MSDLETLGRLYARSRRQGHTTALVEAAKRFNGLIITGNEQHATMLRATGVDAVSLYAVEDFMRGGNHDRPILVDNYTILRLALEAEEREHRHQKRLSVLLAALRDIERIVGTTRDHLEDLR